MKNVLEASHDNYMSVLNVCGRLRDIAESFYIIGQDSLAVRILRDCDILETKAKEVTSAVGLDLHNQIVTQGRATANMVNGMLAAVTATSRRV